MEEAITKVVDKFKSTESSLDEMEKQFDKTFENYLSHQQPSSVTSEEGSTSQSPPSTSLLQEFQSIKEDFATVQKEALELSVLQREALVAFQANILQTVKSAQAITDPSQDGNEAAKKLLEDLQQQSEFIDKMKEQL